MFNNNPNRGISERVSEEKVENLIRKYATGRLQDKPRKPPIPPINGSRDNMETYYVVEVDGKYYKNETKLYANTEIFQHSVYTDNSLLECKRFYSKEDAQKIVDKHGFNVRKVIVKLEG